jgi:F-type H+-transporting ATPase subunit c
MDLSSDFLHYGVIASTIAINSISVGISEGLASYSALIAINRQPAARNDILKVAMIGMTIIETVAIIALLAATILLITTQVKENKECAYYAEIGIALALCIPGFIIGIMSALPVQAACNAVARQPFSTQRIFGFMIMTQVLIQTPIISGLLVSLFIHAQSLAITTMRDSLRLIASGLCVGLGSIGPVIGLSLFSKAAIDGLGFNQKSYQKLLSFTVISEAIIETPIIFCLVIAIMLLFVAAPRIANDNLIDGVIFIAAALCTGLGTLGPGISSGRTGAAACTQIAINPESHALVSRASMLAQGLIETVVIYAILLSLLMILLK